MSIDLRKLDDVVVTVDEYHVWDNSDGLVAVPKCGRTTPEIADLCQMLDAPTNVKRAFIARCERHGTGKALDEYHRYMAIAHRGRTVASLTT